MWFQVLNFGSGYRETVGPKGDWGRAATTRKVLTAVDLNKWAIVFPSELEKDAKKFCIALQQQGPKLGIKVRGLLQQSFTNGTCHKMSENQIFRSRFSYISIAKIIFKF